MKSQIFNRLTAGVCAASMAAFATTAIAQDPASGPADLTLQAEPAPLPEISVSGLKALLYHSDNPSFSNSVEGALVGTGQFGATDIDIFSMLTSGVASLAFLQNYDCVYVWTNQVAPSVVAQGNRLKEYVDAGGGVILATYALSKTQNPWEMQGGIMGPGYSPLVNTTTTLGSFPRVLDPGSALTGHPFVAGVVGFANGGNSNFGKVTLDPGALLVASDTAGDPLLAVSSAGDVAGINIFPPVLFGNTAGAYVALANACTVVSVLRVDIDIKPDSDPNSINLTSNGGVPVAIFGSASFDVTDIDTSTLTMAGAGVRMVGKKNKELCSIEDRDNDGFDDLVCHFDTMDLGALDGTSTEATVTGQLNSGRDFEGTDFVRIVKE